jgi:hypothetical protein
VSLKNGRPLPVEWPERERIARRLRQALRAKASGRHDATNESRIHRLDRRLSQIDAPPAPAKVAEPAPPPAPSAEVPA